MKCRKAMKKVGSYGIYTTFTKNLNPTTKYAEYNNKFENFLSMQSIKFRWHFHNTFLDSKKRYRKIALVRNFA